MDRVPEGLDATFHVSDPTLKDTLLDLHKEGVLSTVLGFSIVAEGRWQTNVVNRAERAIQLVRADSVDLVREPAAGGKFLAVAESEEVIHKEEVINTVPFKEGKTMEITEEKLQELLAEASEKGVEAYKESVQEEEVVEEVESEEETSKVEEALTQLSSTLLDSAVMGASLPEIAEQRIRTQFEGKPFDANAVQKAIADEKDYLATLTKVAVENVTSNKTEIVADEGDKKLARLDASFTPSRVITTKDGQRVKAGEILVKISKDIGKTRDITGGLPRVAELFEARKPKVPAVVTEIDGIIKFGDVKRGIREIMVEGAHEVSKKYKVPYGRHVIVHEGDRVSAGDRLCEGAISPEDILNILGPERVQELSLIHI